MRAGGRRWLRWVNPGGSYLCSSDPQLRPGDGGAVDAIEVLWPDGSREEFSGGPADRIVEVRKGQGRPAASEGVADERGGHNEGGVAPAGVGRP